MSKKMTCSQDPGKGRAGVLFLLFLSVCGRGMNLLKNQGLIYSQAAQRTEGLYRLGSSWILFHVLCSDSQKAAALSTRESIARCETYW